MPLLKRKNSAFNDLRVDDLLVHTVVRTHGVRPRVKPRDQSTARLCGQFEFKVVGLETNLNQLHCLLIQRVDRQRRKTRQEVVA